MPATPAPASRSRKAPFGGSRSRCAGRGEGERATRRAKAASAIPATAIRGRSDMTGADVTRNRSPGSQQHGNACADPFGNAGARNAAPLMARIPASLAFLRFVRQTSERSASGAPPRWASSVATSLLAPVAKSSTVNSSLALPVRRDIGGRRRRAPASASSSGFSAANVASVFGAASRSLIAEQQLVGRESDLAGQRQVLLEQRRRVQRAARQVGQPLARRRRRRACGCGAARAAPRPRR